MSSLNSRYAALPYAYIDESFTNCMNERSAGLGSTSIDLEPRVIDKFHRAQADSDAGQAQSNESPSLTCDPMIDGRTDTLSHSRSTHTDQSPLIQQPMPAKGILDAIEGIYEDDLDADLIRGALEGGMQAFESQEWQEAALFFHEALRIMLPLSEQQRESFGEFDTQYRLAVCIYHTREPEVAEQALLALLQGPPKDNEQCKCVCHAAHLLALLYLRTGQIDRAHSECKRALQARRRIFNKDDEAVLQSTALMAHVYLLLNNRALAKVYLNVIPASQRDAVQKSVHNSLGITTEHLDIGPPLTRSTSRTSDFSSSQTLSRLSATSSVISADSKATNMEQCCYGPVSTVLAQLPATSPRQMYSSDFPGILNPASAGSSAVPSDLPAKSRSVPIVFARSMPIDQYDSSPEIVHSTSLNSTTSRDKNTQRGKDMLTRNEVINRVGCRPRDDLEEAVCRGARDTFDNLISKRKASWRSKLRKHVQVERVTALHFAALFGEIYMARSLLELKFNINEAPYGYSSKLTPLKFAIGARQVDMVEFLVTNGAKPCDSESWSTLAGQLMNRSWLAKTMSEGERDFAPTKFIRILETLFKYGCKVNDPIDDTGRTLLHQAVTFHTASHKWDTHVRNLVTSFLCEAGANAFVINIDGVTPYDSASTAGHNDLLPILSQQHSSPINSRRPGNLVELPV